MTPLPTKLFFLGLLVFDFIQRKPYGLGFWNTRGSQHQQHTTLEPENKNTCDSHMNSQDQKHNGQDQIHQEIPNHQAEQYTTKRQAQCIRSVSAPRFLILSRWPLGWIVLGFFLLDGCPNYKGLVRLAEDYLFLTSGVSVPTLSASSSSAASAASSSLASSSILPAATAATSTQTYISPNVSWTPHPSSTSAYTRLAILALRLLWRPVLVSCLSAWGLFESIYLLFHPSDRTVLEPCTVDPSRKDANPKQNHQSKSTSSKVLAMVFLSLLTAALFFLTYLSARTVLLLWRKWYYSFDHGTGTGVAYSAHVSLWGVN